jgi:flavin reductase (DIM6/NTAB) family NADH-FMN oxidoreductase RutF
MITLHANDLTTKENKKLLSGSIAPRPIALISTLQENNKLNMAPFSYFNIVSGEPPMISVSVRYDTNDQKDTSLNIFRNKEFGIFSKRFEYIIFKDIYCRFIQKHME